MFEGFVGLADYPKDSAVAGMMGGEELASLSKALETGSGIVAANATGGQTFRVQSLEGTLKLATEKSEKELVLWPKIAKDPAFSTTIEFTRQEDWGEERDLFVGEVATLPEVEATYKRLAALVKFMAIKKEVSFASTLVKSIVDPMAQKAHEGTMQLLRGAEFGFMYGDSGINSLAFDGFLKQITDAATGTNSDIVLDWEGNPPSEAMLEEAGRIVADHYGYLDYMVMGTRAKSDLTKAMFPYQRTNMPPNAEGRFGAVLNVYDGSNSVMEVKGSRYIRFFRPLSSGMTGAPDQPAGGNVPTATNAGDSSSQLEDSTTYYYWVGLGLTGIESAATQCSATTGTSEKITVSIPDAAFTAGVDATYANIYRSTTNNIATATRIAQVARVGGGNPTTYVDLNQSRDNCTDAVGFTWAPEVLSIKQLAPLMKMDLAQVTTSLPFLLLLYILPLLFVPTKCVRIKNIGVLNEA